MQHHTSPLSFPLNTIAPLSQMNLLISWSVYFALIPFTFTSQESYIKILLSYIFFCHNFGIRLTSEKKKKGKKILKILLNKASKLKWKLMSWKVLSNWKESGDKSTCEPRRKIEEKHWLLWRPLPSPGRFFLNIFSQRCLWVSSYYFSI